MHTTLNIARDPQTVVLIRQQQIVYQHFGPHYVINMGQTSQCTDEKRGLKWWMARITTAANILLGCYKIYRIIVSLF